jgi:transcriptional regulator with XRE-family HTH domain
MENAKDYSSTRNRIFETSEEARQLWKATALKRRIGLLFSRMRAAREFSQKDIVAHTGWDKSFVSRLEGAHGGIPDIQTLARFADTCGLTIGLLVCERPSRPDELKVIDAVSLFSEPVNKTNFSYLDEPNFFESLIDKTIRTNT